MVHKNLLKVHIPEIIKSYEEKLEQTKKLLNKVIKRYKGRAVVTCSFGKCSMVVLHLCLQINPSIAVTFQNTGVQYKECYKHRDKIILEWKINLHQTYPLKNFWRITREYGWPEGKGKKRKNRKATDKCCYYLKERPFEVQRQKNNWNCVIEGIRAEESENRMFVIKKYGIEYKLKQKKYLKVKPIGYWLTEDMDQYIEENNIPLSEIYFRGAIRSGCGPCTAYKDWEKQLSGLNWKMYQRVKKRRGEPILSDHFKPCKVDS